VDFSGSLLCARAGPAARPSITRALIKARKKSFVGKYGAPKGNKSLDESVRTGWVVKLD